MRISFKSLVKRENVKTMDSKAKRQKGLDMEGPKVESVEVPEGTFVPRWDVHVTNTVLHDTGVVEQLLTRGVLALNGDHIAAMSKEEFKTSFFQSRAREMTTSSFCGGRWRRFKWRTRSSTKQMSK
ncbi:hypothetical protein NE237_020044 [Protea cynaroides]|uniref:Uncharacterized protein n=1 Tax=Protea cynaroides TaxID=273540 RepID=A0A9Q0H6I6_9MAGN|nr:hypothetical protein NE237_020044 [Protea cynaroides]